MGEGVSVSQSGVHATSSVKDEVRDGVFGGSCRNLASGAETSDRVLEPGGGKQEADSHSPQPIAAGPTMAVVAPAEVLSPRCRLGQCRLYFPRGMPAPLLFFVGPELECGLWCLVSMPGVLEKENVVDSKLRDMDR